jgi:glutamate synthase (NADPH) large chain
VLKVMSKMGISTLQSYRGAQIFEAVGSPERGGRYFTDTASRVGGSASRRSPRRCATRPARAFGRGPPADELDSGGEYQWRRDGELHLFTPETSFRLQQATRTGEYKVFGVHEQCQRPEPAAAPCAGLFRLEAGRRAVPLDEVEPVEAEIVRRFVTGAMSFGSISQEAHETLAIAMNRLGGQEQHRRGRRGPGPASPDPNGDSRRSAIKQVASGRFGVTSEYLVNADDLQIKMAQGAKPGEGGQLPGFTRSTRGSPRCAIPRRVSA